MQSNIYILGYKCLGMPSLLKNPLILMSQSDHLLIHMTQKGSHSTAMQQNKDMLRKEIVNNYCTILVYLIMRRIDSECIWLSFAPIINH